MNFRSPAQLLKIPIFFNISFSDLATYDIKNFRKFRSTLKVSFSASRKDRASKSVINERSDHGASIRVKKSGTFYREVPVNPVYPDPVQKNYLRCF